MKLRLNKVEAEKLLAKKKISNFLELANKAGLTNTTVSRMVTKHGSLESAVKIANVLEVEIDEIFFVIN